MWSCLKLAVEENTYLILNPKELIKINEKEFDNIFRDDNDRLPLYMLKKERISNLIDLGKKLNKNWDNCFLNLLIHAGSILFIISNVTPDTWTPIGTSFSMRSNKGQ